MNRHSPLSEHFVHKFLFWGDKRLQTRSHQEVFNQAMVEEFSLFPTSIKLLDERHFPQGKVYHHSKSLMHQITTHKQKAFIFHMCWTKNKVDKLRYLKRLKMWYLDNTCSESMLAKPRALQDPAKLHACCKLDDNSLFSAWL